MPTGIYKRTKEHGEHISEGLKVTPNRVRMKFIQKGEHVSPRTEFKKGNSPPKHRLDCKCFRCFPQERIYEKGIHLSPDTEFKKGWKQSKELIKKRLRRREKSTLELKTEKIIQKYNFPYKFVGNGEFFIERKNPDFVNINGEKIAIEVYYRKHKELFRGGLFQWKKEREKVFNNYGWNLIFFDETQVNEEHIKGVLNGH